MSSTSSSSRLKRDCWLHLPDELLNAISKHIDTKFETIQFRSVCQSWRSSTPPTPPFFSPVLPVPILDDHDITHTRLGSCKLVETTIYTLRPKEQLQTQPESGSSWLIKVEEESPNVVHLIDPLLRWYEYAPPEPFSEVLNLSDFQIYGLCKETDDASRFSPKRGIYYWSSNVDVNVRKVILTSSTANHEASFDDLIHYKGQFIVVDSTGQTFVMDPYTLSSTTLANRVVKRYEEEQMKQFRETNCVPIIYVDSRRHLIISNKQLFLVDIYVEEHGPNWPCDSHGQCMPIDCKVFVLDEEQQQWVPVESLGDRVFLLSPQGSYSISALDFPGCKGNRIFFTDYEFSLDRGKDTFSHNIGVFDLKDGTFEELADSSYLLFWPPPTWISTPNSD
ncbi:hypothetical protein IFM89_036278 [Coptis chinensis]|uniref:F-box protein n=1 Tax=Coptis chinensis TaxID=261450 RepID=A0A835IJ54_9MAGN|nr:hypothetical protein IFM89_036278 [Coptis chinensis]